MASFEIRVLFLQQSIKGEKGLNASTESGRSDTEQAMEEIDHPTQLQYQVAGNMLYDTIKNRI